LSERRTVTESAYQAQLIKKIKRMFPGCMVLKNDPQYIQGILDLTILYCDLWAMLEVKAGPSSPFRPNQEHYLEQLDRMSFAAVIYPEIEEDVLNALQETFSSRGAACVPLS
jgi:hypothetical protein